MKIFNLCEERSFTMHVTLRNDAGTLCLTDCILSKVRPYCLGALST